MVPQVLDSYGLLNSLYTDSYAESTLGRIVSFLKRIGFHSSEIDRLLNRKTGISKSKIYANDFLQVKLLWHKLINSPSLKFKELRFEGSSSSFIHRGCSNANVLYNMFIENFEFAQYSKNKGLSIICDFYENPFIYKELAEDINAEPEYSCISNKRKEYLESHYLRMKYLERMLRLADAYLIPSKHVASALEKSPGFDSTKVHIIPYAPSITNQSYCSNPQIGRIIWIGNEAVRKGLVYCERAAEYLKEYYSYLDFRIIGSIDKQIVESDSFQHLNFIGHLNKEQIIEEYKQADILVFPTLSEGFSGALLEAASYGIPIITTHSSGFDDDFPGIFVEPRNTKAIVDSVTYLLEDRKKRDSISHNIYNYVHSIDRTVFSKQLIELINSL